MRMKQTRYLQDDSEIRTKINTRTSKDPNIKLLTGPSATNEELTRKITIKLSVRYAENPDTKDKAMQTMKN